MKNSMLCSRLMIALVAGANSLQAPLARGEMVNTEDMTAQSQASAERAKVQNFVDQANVKERLQAMGVDGLVVKDRVAALSQEEVHALAQRIDAMPVGGNLGTMDMILIVLVAILVAIII